MTKKNLVIGCIRGYKYEQIKVFIESLLNSGFNGDLVMLVNNVSRETLDMFDSKGVKWKEFDFRGSGAQNSWSRFWPKLKPIVQLMPEGTKRLVMKSISDLLKARFFHVTDFLRENISVYQNVLIADVRDVFFQGDPFAQPMQKVQGFEESGVIGQETYCNVPWIKELFGPNALDTFSDKKIICAGTIMGPVPKVIDFLAAFEKMFFKADSIITCGSDQGIYNYFIRTQKPDIEINPYENDRVLTVSNSIDYSPAIKNNQILAQNGKVIPVIHQYDRSKEINSVVEQKFNLAKVAH